MPGWRLYWREQYRLPLCVIQTMLKTAKVPQMGSAEIDM